MIGVHFESVNEPLDVLHFILSAFYTKNLQEREKNGTLNTYIAIWNYSTLCCIITYRKCLAYRVKAPTWVPFVIKIWGFPKFLAFLLQTVWNVYWSQTSVNKINKQAGSFESLEQDPKSLAFKKWKCIIWRKMPIFWQKTCPCYCILSHKFLKHCMFLNTIFNRLPVA